MTDEDKKLGIRAATTFKELFPELWKHDMEHFDTAYHTPSTDKTSAIYQCCKCQHWEHLITDYGLLPMSDSLRRSKRLLLLKKRAVATPCTVPDPIDINDWNVAYKLARSVDGELFRATLTNIWWQQTTGTDFSLWLLVAATPADLILAACIAKERE